MLKLWEYWGQENIEVEKRLQAIKIIQSSIDRGIPAVSWDIGICEWGLITGYDDEAQIFDTLPINAKKADPHTSDYITAPMPFDVLGRREVPVLSVLTITGRSDKPRQDILKDTLKLAVSHLRGEEWCENAKGLTAYPALIRHFKENPETAASWNAEYFLGTYAALKEYAARYFEKEGLSSLARLYQTIYGVWLEAFQIKTSSDASAEPVRKKISALLGSAYDTESEALRLMENMI